jgi:uncharacterized coiled-coil DUF342 family protein
MEKSEYNNADLNELFNFTYNFDLLKGIIETLLKNQGALQKQLDELYSSNEDKDKIIQDMEADIKSLKETKLNINEFNELKPEIEKMNNHLKQNDKKIEECNFIIL